jgi:hypothetical protein
MKTATQLVEEHAFTLCEALKGSMKTYLLIFLGLLLCSPTHAEERNTYKKDVTLWYEAIRVYLRPFESSRALMCHHETQE